MERDDLPAASMESTEGASAGPKAPGRGCSAILLIVLVVLLLCCCIVVGLAGVATINPELRELFTGLFGGLLGG